MKSLYERRNSEIKSLKGVIFVKFETTEDARVGKIEKISVDSLKDIFIRSLKVFQVWKKF